MGKAGGERVNAAYRILNINFGVLLANVLQPAVDDVHVLVSQHMIFVVRELGGHGFDGAGLDIGRGRIVGVGENAFGKGSCG